MDNIKDLLRGEPLFVPAHAVEKILGAERRRVTPKGVPDLYEVKSLTKKLRAYAPSRMAHLNDWLDEQRARIEAHNRAVQRYFDLRLRTYQDELRMDVEQASRFAAMDTRSACQASV